MFGGYGLDVLSISWELQRITVIVEVFDDAATNGSSHMVINW